MLKSTAHAIDRQFVAYLFDHGVSVRVLLWKTNDGVRSDLISESDDRQISFSWWLGSLTHIILNAQDIDRRISTSIDYISLYYYPISFLSIHAYIWYMETPTPYQQICFISF